MLRCIKNLLTGFNLFRSFFAHSTMTTEHPSSPATASFPTDLHPQIEATYKELNMRIVRLALALGLSLDTDADMARVMNHHTAASAVPHDPAASSNFGFSNERRTEQNWTELRGLIVLRDELHKRSVEAIGLVATSDILVDIEERMMQQGFKPGAYGLDLQSFLNRPVA